MSATKEAKEKIDLLLAEAHAKIAEAEKLAIENKTTFHWDLAYGMGGYFDGETPEDELTDNWGDRTESRWCASSQGC